MVFEKYTERASGAWVDFQKIEELFCKKDRGLPDLGRPRARSNGREKRTTWPRWPASFWCVNRKEKIIYRLMEIVFVLGSRRENARPKFSVLPICF